MSTLEAKDEAARDEIGAVTEGLVLFALAFTASAATPGPDTLTIFSKALSRGGLAAAPFTLGVVLGKLILLTLVVFGLAAVADLFEPLFALIKFAGAVYLVWMGVRLWVKKPATQMATAESNTRWGDAVTGLALGVSNPNAVIFYVALLPTLVDMQRVTFAVYLALCAVLVVVMLVIASVYAFSADRMRGLLRSERARRVTDRVAGTVMLGAGIVVATR